MRVVADANALVSAALARSPQAPSPLAIDPSRLAVEIITPRQLVDRLG